MAYFLILAAAILRLLPHIPNFAPITAIALFGSVYLNKRYALIIPLAAMFLSDIFIGFYNPAIMISVYLSFAISGLLGLLIRKNKSFGRVAGMTLLASIQFYLITNFAVWAFGTMYTHNFVGLMASYANALPFFRNTLLGDFFYVGAMFGLYEIVSARNKAVVIIPKPRPSSVDKSQFCGVDKFFVGSRLNKEMRNKIKTIFRSNRNR